MAIIDAQVHAYERDHPGRPWHSPLHGPDEVTGDDMVAAMDRVGVDGALLVSPWTMYRFDPSYAIEVQAAHPTRFGLVTPVDPRDDAVADRIAEWKIQPGAVGIRLMFWRAGAGDAEHPGVDTVLTAAARHGLPVCMLAWGHLDLVDRLAAAHPNTQLVVDHLGLRQPFEPPVPEDGFADLPQLLALARHDNVAVKVTGACTLSRRSFPFDDLWEPLGRIFDAFGLERCMWGTDWTRAVGLCSYGEATASFRDTDRLTPAERDVLMGGALSRIFGWSPGDAAGDSTSDAAS